MIGKKFTHEYNGMTVTSGNGTVRKMYIVREKIGNGYNCELLDTNTSMSYGGGRFEFFTEDNLKGKGLPYLHEINIH